MCSMNTRKSIFFSQTSVRVQLHDTKGVKSQSENRKLYKETLVSRKVYLFHTDFSPNSITMILNGQSKLLKFLRSLRVKLLHKINYVITYLKMYFAQINLIPYDMFFEQHLLCFQQLESLHFLSFVHKALARLLQRNGGLAHLGSQMLQIQK